MHPEGPISIPALPDGFDPAREFPILSRWHFFNHGGVSPLPQRGREALEWYAREATENAYMTGRWYKRAESIRAACAKLINGTSEEIAFIKNTSEGIAFVANGLDWHVGQEIISTAVEYPANVYPWMDLAQRFGVKHIMVPEREGRIHVDELLAAITPKTRMIALSHVEYASGYRNDLVKIGKVCRDRGILFCVDAIQTCGIIPVDVQAMNIDFLSADGHKWLLGPEGCGFFYCARKHIPHLRPEMGWMNVINALDYGSYDFTLRQDAKRFECGSYNIPGLMAFGAALDLLLEVGIEHVWARVRALTDQLCQGLHARGYNVLSSRIPGEESALVAFSAPKGDHARIVMELEKQKIIIVIREGRLRASPHFYNSPEQIAALLAALPEAK